MFYNNLKFQSIIVLSLLCCSLTWAKPLQIVAVTEDFSSIAKAVGGEQVEVQPLVKGSRDLHQVNALPSMAMKLRNADMVIRLGMQQDAWLDGALQVAKNNRITQGSPGYLDASIGIRKLDVRRGKIDGRLGDVHRAGNPHYWLSPKNGIVIAEEIRDHLIALDPDHANLYQTRYENFAADINKKIPQWRQKLSKLKGVAIVTYHPSWDYFFDCFDLANAGTLEPLPGIPPTVGHLNQLKKSIEGRPVLIFQESFYDSDSAQRLAAEVKGRFVQVPGNVGNEVKTYDQLFETIINRLVKE